MLPFGRGNTRPSIEARTTAGWSPWCPDSVGVIPDPPLKLKARDAHYSSRCYSVGVIPDPPLKLRCRTPMHHSPPTFGRGNTRPSIEAVMAAYHCRQVLSFGRGNTRPSIEACRPGLISLCSTHSVGVIPDPPLKPYLVRCCRRWPAYSVGVIPDPPLKPGCPDTAGHRLDSFGRGNTRPSIEASLLSEATKSRETIRSG